MNDKAKIDALRAALQFFIDRCDSGLAQSKTTYAKFKDVLALTADASEQAPAAPVADTGAVAEMEARKDAAYYERNQVVAALAKCFPSGKARTAIEGWSEDWHGCVYIDLPTGQVSWHYHDSQAHLFNSIPHYLSAWDGHDTDEKYRRLAALRTAPASPAPTADSAADARDSERLEFVLGRQAFIMTIPESKTGRPAMYQLMEQDEDEDFHVISGEGEAFRTKREAIDAAIDAMSTNTGEGK